MLIALTDLDFLLKPAQNCCEKCTFFDNLTQEGNYTNDPFFSSTFSALSFCNFHLKLVKFHFPFGPFWAKATNLDSSSCFFRK